MKPETLRKKLQLGEGQELEWKATANPRSIGRAVCSFLNAGGGCVLIGVNDRGEVTGLPADSDLQQLEQQIARGLAPSALVSFETQELSGKTVWVVEVPAGKDIPYAFQNEIFIRQGEHSRRADVETIRDMILRRQVEPERWERRYSEANLASDLDEREVRTTAAKVDESGRAAQKLADAPSPVEVLERLGMVRYGRLTNGGDVLFGQRPAQRHPQLRVRAVNYGGEKSGSSYRDLRNLEGPLVAVLEQAHAFIAQNTPSRVRFLAGALERQQTSLYPPMAIREGLVNAFAHRDYADFKGGVAIHIHPNRLEIWNSGSFLDGITPDALKEGRLSVLRNPDIAHVLYLRGLMEKLGRGSLLILNACDQAGLPAPQWSSSPEGGVTLTFFTPEVAPEVTPEVAPEDTPEVRLARVLVGEMARQQLQSALGLKDDEHFRRAYLLPALEAGLVEMTVPDKPRSSRQKYRLTAKGRALLASIPGKDDA